MVFEVLAIYASRRYYESQIREKGLRLFIKHYFVTVFSLTLLQMFKIYSPLEPIAAVCVNYLQRRNPKRERRLEQFDFYNITKIFDFVVQVARHFPTPVEIIYGYSFNVHVNDSFFIFKDANKNLSYQWRRILYFNIFFFLLYNIIILKSNQRFTSI